MSVSIHKINSKIAALDTSHNYPHVTSAQPNILTTAIDRVTEIFQTRIIFGSFDINPINHLFKTPDLNELVNKHPAEEVPKFNFSANRTMGVQIESEKLPNLTQKKFNQFAKNAASYHLTSFLYKDVCGHDPSKEQISIIPTYLKIVREVNSANSKGSSNYLSIFFKNFEGKLSLFQKLKVTIVYLIFENVLEDFIKELFMDIIKNVLRKYSNKDNLSNDFKAILKRLYSFFSDYQNSAIKYVNARKNVSNDSSLQGNFDDFLKREMRTESFLRSENQNGYNEEELRNEFANIVNKYLPKVSLVKLKLKKIGLKNWKPSSNLEYVIKKLLIIPHGLLQVLLALPYSIVDVILNLYIKYKLVGTSFFSYKNQGIIQQAIESFTDKGWNDSYRKAFDKVIYDQLKEIEKRSQSNSTITSIKSVIDEETRELIHGLVQSLIVSLDIHSKKNDGWKSIGLAINDKLSEGFIDKILDLDHKARDGIESSIEEGIIGLYDYLTQDNMLNYLVDTSLDTLNSLYEDERQSFDSSTRSKVLTRTKEIINPSTRESVRATLGNGFKIAQSEGQKFYNRIKSLYAPKLKAIRSHIKYILSSNLISEESIQASIHGLLEFRHQLFDKEFHDFKSRYFNEFKTLAREIPKSLYNIFNLQNYAFQYLKEGDFLWKRRISYIETESKLTNLVSFFTSQKYFKAELNKLSEAKEFLTNSFFQKIIFLNNERVNINNEINILSSDAKFIENSLNINNHFSAIYLLLFLKKQNLSHEYLTNKVESLILRKIHQPSEAFKQALHNLIRSEHKDLEKYKSELQAQVNLLSRNILKQKQKKSENLTAIESDLHDFLEKEIKHNKQKQSQLEKNCKKVLQKASEYIHSMEHQIFRLRTKNVTTKNNLCLFFAASYLGLDTKIYGILKVHSLLTALNFNYFLNHGLSAIGSLKKNHLVQSITGKIKDFVGSYTSVTLPPITEDTSFTPLLAQTSKVFAMSKCFELLGNFAVNGFADYFVKPKIEKRVNSAFSFISDNQTFRGLVNSVLLLNVDLIKN